MIEKINGPNSLPINVTDFQAQNNLTAALALGLQMPMKISGGDVLAGSIFYVGGTLYKATSDTAITGVASDYVKLTPSGDASTLAASYVASLAGVTWNSVYKGYYDISGNLYVFNEQKAIIAGEIATIKGDFLQQSEDGSITLQGPLNFKDSSLFEYDSVNGYFEMNKPILLDSADDNDGGSVDTQIVQQTGVGSTSFHLLKPLSVRFDAASSAYIDLWANNGFINFYSASAAIKVLAMNPGLYRLRNESPGGTSTLYCVGVFGTPDFSIAGNIIS